MVAVAVKVEVCTRCAACATVAPSIFSVTRKGVRLLSQPDNEAERRASVVASLLCPARAITAEVTA